MTPEGALCICSAPKCTRSLRRFRQGTKYCSPRCRKRGQRDRERKAREKAERLPRLREERARYGLPPLDETEYGATL
jgi:hypothetical protein